MNRFWRTVLTGTAAGALVGIYLYTKSKGIDLEHMQNTSKSEKIKDETTHMLVRSTNRFLKSLGKEITRAGKTLQVLGTRLNIGGIDQ